MMQHPIRMTAAALALMLLAGCTAPASVPASSAGASSAVSGAASAAMDQVAGSGDMAEPQTVGEADMTPVTADQIQDGVYAVTVDSSSSMFRITACTLAVTDGKMTAKMTMSGTGYKCVYMGTAAEAAADNGASAIDYTENADGTHSFTVPVAALDQPLDCAAFSAKKEKWYDRQILFRADSLPDEAWRDSRVTTVAELGLADGSYTVEAALEGGSGRSSVESPARLRVENGQAFVTLVWNSPNYDYMKVDGTQYLPLQTGGNSTFEIPAAGFDGPLAITADTVAMSTPHEIDYTLTLDSATLQQVSE